MPRFWTSSCFERIGAFIGGSSKKEHMTLYATVDWTVQHTANTTGQGTACTAEAPVRRRVVARGRRLCGCACRFGTLHWPGGLPHSARARIATTQGFCFVLGLSLLVTGFYSDTCAFAFFAAWFSFRWKVFRQVSSAPRPRFHQGCFLYTVPFRHICLGQFCDHHPRIHAVTLSHFHTSEMKMISVSLFSHMKCNIFHRGSVYCAARKYL